MIAAVIGPTALAAPTRLCAPLTRVDLIVAASNRRADARDEASAKATAVRVLPHVDRAAVEDLEELERRAVDVLIRELADLMPRGGLVAAFQADLGAAETPPERRFLPRGTS